MAYTKKGYRKGGTKKYVKKGKKYAKKNTSKSLVALIKRVSLKQSETKYTHSAGENIQIQHNVGSTAVQLLYTSQGTADTGTGSSFYAARLGDEVIARGISIKLWIANKLDRPNVMYRFVVYRHQNNFTPTFSNIQKNILNNRIMDDMNKEKITVLYQKIFNLQVGYSAFSTATTGDTDGREAHKYLQVWIPLKNKKIYYDDGGGLPKFTDISFTLYAYDSYGTLTTDNIASYAYEHKFYFKDP